MQADVVFMQVILELDSVLHYQDILLQARGVQSSASPPTPNQSPLGLMGVQTGKSVTVASVGGENQIQPAQASTGRRCD